MEAGHLEQSELSVTNTCSKSAKRKIALLSRSRVYLEPCERFRIESLAKIGNSF